jgi:hypothetical protein
MGRWMSGLYNYCPSSVEEVSAMMNEQTIRKIVVGTGLAIAFGIGISIFTVNAQHEMGPAPRDQGADNLTAQPSTPDQNATDAPTSGDQAVAQVKSKSTESLDRVAKSSQKSPLKSSPENHRLRVASGFAEQTAPAPGTTPSSAAAPASSDATTPSGGADDAVSDSTAANKQTDTPDSTVDPR